MIDDGMSYWPRSQLRFTTVASAAHMIWDPRFCRFILVGRFEVLWLRQALAKRTLPVPVILNRFLAELFVLILGISHSIGGRMNLQEEQGRFLSGGRAYPYGPHAPLQIPDTSL